MVESFYYVNVDMTDRALSEPIELPIGLIDPMITKTLVVTFENIKSADEIVGNISLVFGRLERDNAVVWHGAFFIPDLLGKLDILIVHDKIEKRTYLQFIPG